MASSSIFESAPPEPEEERRNWLELPREVTASILSRLVAIDILTTAQFVCKSWLEISKDPLVWRRIDMYKAGDLDLEMDLDKMCRHAVDRSCGQLVDINIEYFGNDDLLKYIADRSNQIKRIRLACCYHHVSDEGLIEAVAKLPLLEDLELTLCPFSVEPLQAIGRSCPNLKSFSLNCQAYRILHIDPDEEVEYNREAIAIGKNMPGLRHLQVIGNTMTNMGLEAILAGCPHLESLDLRRCLNISLKGDLWKRCTEQIKHLRLPHDPSMEYEYINDASELGSFDDYHHWFSGGEDDDDEYHELIVADELDYSDHSDISSGNDSFDYDDLSDPDNM